MAQVDLAKLDYGNRRTGKFLYYNDPAEEKDEILADDYFYPAYENGSFSKEEIIAVRWEVGINIEKVIWLRVYWDDGIIKSEEVTAEDAGGVGTGDVVGPSSSIAGEIAFYANTTGKLISGDSTNLYWDDGASELKTVNLSASGNIGASELFAGVECQGAILKGGITNIPSPPSDIPLVIGQVNPTENFSKGMSMGRMAESEKVNMTNPHTVNAEEFIQETWSPETAYNGNDIFSTPTAWAAQILDLSYVATTIITYPAITVGQWAYIPGYQATPDRTWDFAQNYPRNPAVEAGRLYATTYDATENAGYIRLKGGHVYEATLQASDSSLTITTQLNYKLGIGTTDSFSSAPVVDPNFEEFVITSNPSIVGTKNIVINASFAPADDVFLFAAFYQTPGGTDVPNLVSVKLTARCVF